MAASARAWSNLRFGMLRSSSPSSSSLLTARLRVVHRGVVLVRPDHDALLVTGFLAVGGDLHRDGHRALIGWLAVGRTGPRRARITAPDRGEDLGDLFLVERLVFEQLQDQVVEHLTVLDQDVERLLVCGLDELADLFVDLTGDVL